MSIQQLADRTAREILASMQAPDIKLETVSRIVEKAVLTTMAETRSGCVDVVHQCCRPDQDLAHKISQRIRQREQALIANLSSLR